MEVCQVSLAEVWTVFCTKSVKSRRLTWATASLTQARLVWLLGTQLVGLVNQEHHHLRRLQEVVQVSHNLPKVRGSNGNGRPAPVEGILA